MIMTADILREKFLAFFKARKHKIMDSDSLVPKDDPTVLFTPAGMNQFKKEFLGFDSGFKRAATAQRCLRTDDLDKVGKTSVHHTFFEMLGNFSFGDYFKQEAISWAWEFLTEELKISPDKLWVSVYQDDEEAYDIWKSVVKIPVNKIIRLGDKDNFWPAEAKTKGPNGPCGPCSEIFFDFGKEAGCQKPDCTPACSCGRFAEIWNLVFTQFNRKADGSLEPLPNKNIDTGMGLERLAALMQGKKNNFETELFQPIVREIEVALKKNPPLPPFEKGGRGGIYAVADHIRAVVFSIHDGITPSNEGRGYIVRKIIRKSVLHLRNLGINKPFLYTLVDLVSQIMHKPYPDLKDKREDIARVILNEENNFIRTLNSSNDLFKDKFSCLSQGQDPEKAGRIAFQLYDTYGIPLELTKVWLNEQGIQISQGAFDQELLEQMTRSRLQSSMKGDVFDVKGLGLRLKETKFLGYKNNSIKAKIIEIIDPNKKNRQLTQISLGMKAVIILDETPFYAESGGQVGDTGELIDGNNVFEVLDTKKNDNVILHIGQIKSGNFKKDDTVVAQINVQRRLNIARNHTATHILQATLREILGNHVQQQGSLVSAEKLRFDFTHFKGLSPEEIARVEEVANSYIIKNYEVDSKEMELKDAKKAGALAFFEEKYGENVRVVAIGNISKELCAGTHLTDIKQIGLIKIISESSVASGIRRIEAVTAEFAEQFIREQEQKAIEESQKKSRLRELKAQEKKRSAEINNLLPARSLELLKKSVKINATIAVFSVEDNLDLNALRILTDMLKGKLAQAVIALGSQDGSRASLVIGLTADLCAKGLSAKNIIFQVAPLIGGSGGGREDFAQAGGTHPENFILAFEKIKDIIKSCA
ncbi:MAG: alanine--tRNA ligase [Candidatus Omnitrophica bacterium]|nr:alanine--tRNA ligase [Candidatus Omnitrophota bacterium]MBU4303141.1 alanine--tRNA ligase [Candidatus Omnitrophota bacterium]MBU4467170.1 alanine--tRNA ligase [Candidatus Omnitrophota bacterium]MCG2708281.1 alanine--tRNA ligase [Candidatus Omnitrophota bacterium]